MPHILPPSVKSQKSVSISDKKSGERLTVTHRFIPMNKSEKKYFFKCYLLLKFEGVCTRQVAFVIDFEGVFAFR